jgi:lipid-binding SYLF domain-containing protein
MRRGRADFTPGVFMRRRFLPAIVVLAALAAPRIASLHAQDEQHQTRCNQTVDLFKKTDPDLGKYFGSAVGYAIFPSVGKGAFIVGGAAGTGCLYQGGAIIGQAKLAQVTVGLQLGGQSYAEVIFFQNDDAIAAFKSNSFELSAQVSAVAAASGASANAKYRLGVLVFTIAKTGLMYEASVGGQKFTFHPLAKEAPKPEEKKAE